MRNCSSFVLDSSFIPNQGTVLVTIMSPLVDEFYYYNYNKKKPTTLKKMHFL